MGIARWLVAVLCPVCSLSSVCWAGSSFGIWTVSTLTSTPGRLGPTITALRIEKHAKGEVFTLDRIDAQGRRTSSSTILYLDDEPRNFQDFECSGTQSSRQVDAESVEIHRVCEDGERVWLLKQSARPDELIVRITQKQRDGRQFEWHMILKKQEKENSFR
jgi:hypothetical protein